MDRVLFRSGVMMVSRKSTESFAFVSSTVNFMAMSMECMCCRKLSSCSTYCITKVSSTCLFHNPGGFFTVLRALTSKASMTKLVTIGVTWNPWLPTLSACRTVLGIWKYLLCRQNPNRCMMWCIDIIVLCWCYVSCSNLCLITSMAWLTGTEVKRSLTSYEKMHSPVSSSVFLIYSTNSWVLLAWHVDLPTSGLRFMAYSLADPLPYMWLNL